MRRERGIVDSLWQIARSPASSLGTMFLDRAVRSLYGLWFTISHMPQAISHPPSLLDRPHIAAVEQLLQVTLPSLGSGILDLVVHQGIKGRLLSHPDHTYRRGEGRRSHAAQQETQDRVMLVMNEEVRSADAIPEGHDLRRQAFEADAAVLGLAKDHGLAML